MSKCPAQGILGGVVCCLQNGASLPSNAFQGWSALQTLTLSPEAPMYDEGRASPVQLTDTAITYLAQCSLPELHSLYLGIAFSTEAAKAVASANLPKLHTLHIDAAFNSAALRHLAQGRWPCLKVLVIEPGTDFDDWDCACYPHNFDPFAECNWPLLERLSASTWGHTHLFTPEGRCKWPKLKTLTASCIHGQPGSCHPYLRSLVLREVPEPACRDDALAMQLPALRQYKVTPGVMSMDPDRAYVKVSDLVTKGNWPLLAHLSLQNQNLSRQGLAPLQQANWSHMYKLDLSCNDLNAEAVQSLVACKWPHLRRLKLAYNQMDEYALGALSHGKWPRLQTLGLRDNSIDNASVQHLVQGAWPELVHLDLRGNRLYLHAMTTLLKGSWPRLTNLYLDENITLGVPEVLELCKDVASLRRCAFGGLLQAWPCDCQTVTLSPNGTHWGLHDHSLHMHGYETDSDDSGCDD